MTEADGEGRGEGKHTSDVKEEEIRQDGAIDIRLEEEERERNKRRVEEAK